MLHLTLKSLLVIIVFNLFFRFSNADRKNIEIEGEEKITEVTDEMTTGVCNEGENEAIEAIFNNYKDEIVAIDNEQIYYNPIAEIKEKEIDKTLLEKLEYQIMLYDILAEATSSTDIISMKRGDCYSGLKGVTTFRGNTFRDAASYGYASINEEKLEIIWNLSTGGIDGWTGVGWNGQPAIVEWDEDIIGLMNIDEEKKGKPNLKEVIYGTLDGNIYFIDLDDGKYTRDPIKVPASIKGSVTVDPRGLPLLYAGQGLNKVGGKTVETGYRIFSLLNQQRLCFINGVDSFAHRRWPAFDSTALIDRETDTMFICGENGLFYKVKLNTNFNPEENKISIEPQIVKYRYKILGNKHQGIENSLSMYKNLAYFADNGGWLQCIDINDLKPVWIRDITDDTDSTIVLEENSEGVFLYTGCEVDKQGARGNSYIRKIDALSGNLIWEKSYICDSILGQQPNNGGILATPVVGKHKLDNIVIFNIARCEGFSSGLVVALDKTTGEEVWKIKLNNYSWSSPVSIYTEEGHGYIILCDSAGNVFLIEGTTGNILDKINLGANVEGSPAVFENMIVVGTRGQKIYGINIK